MKKLKIAALLTLASLTSLSAQALTWNTVKITLTGATVSGGIFIKATSVTGNTTFTDRLFKLTGSIEDIGLAISMAAVSSNRQVVIQSNIDELDNETYPVIRAIYLSSDVTTN